MIWDFYFNQKIIQMKKITLLFLSVLVYVSAYSQFTVNTYDTNQNPTGTIEDGDLFAFNTLDYDTAAIYFGIQNDNPHSINVRIVYEEITNADGSLYEFCFGSLCIFAVEEGVLYPEEGGPVIIASGEESPSDIDHFLNKNEGDGSNYPMDYLIKIFEVDENDVPNGNELTFTYRYDPTMSVSDFNSSVKVSLQNTLVESQLNILAEEPVNVEIFNIQGKKINNYSLQVGTHSIEAGNLSAGIYLARITNEYGQSSVFKLIKK